MIRKLARIAIAAALLGAYPLFVVAQTFEGALPGTSGHAVPFLDGSNNWSTTQTFNSTGNDPVVVNGTSTQGVNIVNSSAFLRSGADFSAGAYNPIVQAGDDAIIFNGTGGSGTGSLAIAPWNASAAGLRIQANGNAALTGVFGATALNATTVTNGNGVQLGGTTVLWTNGNYTQINSPTNQTSAAIFLVGNANDPESYHRGNVIFQTIGGVQFGSIQVGGSLSLGGSTPAVNGTINLSGLTSGTITIQPQAAAGTYNFNLPTTPGAAGTVLTSQGGGSNAMTWSAVNATTLPTTQKFTSGTNLTYTTPANVTWIEGYLIGGGGGGGGGDSGSVGAAGGGTCWNTSGTACTTPLWEAGGGSSGTGSTAQSIVSGGSGGSVSGSQNCDLQAPGQNGGGNATVGLASTIGAAGAYGGSSWLGGGGSGVYDGQGTGGNVNTGSGGAGGGIAAVGASPGSGGGAGAFCHFIIKTPAATYVYTVGVAGAASTGGASGSNGGAGAAGLIVIIEHYGS